MATDPTLFRDKIAELIKSWEPDDFQVEKEKVVGLRFVASVRKLDIIVHSKETGKTMAIEAKLQLNEGTTYQKLTYTLEDCLASPIPTIVAFAGKGIKQDLKSKLITSGIGIEMGYNLDKEGHISKVLDPLDLLRQRVYIALDKNWMPFANSGNLSLESYGDAYSDT